MNDIPFRELRQDTKAVIAMSSLLLALPEQKWKQSEYATFMYMAQVTKGTKNPSRNWYKMMLVVWLRFCKALIEQLPEGELRTNSLAEFYKLSVRYQRLLEVKAK